MRLHIHKQKRRHKIKPTHKHMHMYVNIRSAAPKITKSGTCSAHRAKRMPNNANIACQLQQNQQQERVRQHFQRFFW